ncbi:hypothetical protein R3P38DRAFT_2990465 [Favolaschia claudopus]|uniref:Uncharacterized protein n=1 Tax=Favolaschia claudopus TaxID=2862362 RepID=A0AAW0AT55_9AGAR
MSSFSPTSTPSSPSLYSQSDELDDQQNAHIPPCEKETTRAESYFGNLDTTRLTPASMLWSSPSIYSQPEQTEEQELSEYPFQVPGYEGEMWLHRGTDPWSAYSARFQAIIAQHVNDSPNVGVNTHPMSLCSGFSDPGLPATWKRLDSHFLADADLTAECPMHIHPLPSLLNTPDSIRYPKSKAPTWTVLHPVRTSLDDSLLHIHPLQLEMHSQKTLSLPPLSVQRSTATSAVKTRSSVDLDTSSGQWPTPTATMGMEQLCTRTPFFAAPAISQADRQPLADSPSPLPMCMVCFPFMAPIYSRARESHTRSSAI